jgi:hypothetical protein
MVKQRSKMFWPKSFNFGHRRQRYSGIALTTALALATTGGLLATHLVAPPAAVAYTSRLSLFLTRDANESFDVFVQRAEIITRAAVQRSFDADILITDVAITVVGSNQGVSMPVLSIEVSRADWQLNPDVQYWATYFSTAEGLMELQSP